MTSGLIISNPYDDKCNTPRYDSVCEHCDPKFSSDTHKNPSSAILFLSTIISPPFGQEFYYPHI